MDFGTLADFFGAIADLFGAFDFFSGSAEDMNLS
ncbi:hypothetical protein RR21198_4924 [Rhodococcus rhodochrous ATCC 21198]|jgi:hypothetical protein|nr:hypothetical protein RR21198_4924 [Rhodococcus rhodochrous ATCC 21198]NCL76839.1 hypothetical protein [Rhodococcus sp. YH1]